MKNLFIFILLFSAPLITSANSFIEYPDFEYGVTNPQVTEIQKFLNTNGYTVSEVVGEPGSAGYEGTYFGKLTKKALSFFQTKNNITPASGYFGTKTKEVFDTYTLKTSKEADLSSSSGPITINEAPETQKNSRKSVYANPAYKITVNHYKDGKYYSSQYYTYPTYSSLTFTYTITENEEVLDSYGYFEKWGGNCSGTKGNVCVFTIWDISGDRTIDVHWKSQCNVIAYGGYNSVGGFESKVKNIVDNFNKGRDKKVKFQKNNFNQARLVEADVKSKIAQMPDNKKVLFTAHSISAIGLWNTVQSGKVPESFAYLLFDPPYYADQLAPTLWKTLFSWVPIAGNNPADIQKARNSKIEFSNKMINWTCGYTYDSYTDPGCKFRTKYAKDATKKEILTSLSLDHERYNQDKNALSRVGAWLDNTCR